jgi:hypothetical protein
MKYKKFWTILILFLGCKSKIKVFEYEVGMTSSERLSLLNKHKAVGIVQANYDEPNSWFYDLSLTDTTIKTKLIFDYQTSPLDPIKSIKMDLVTDVLKKQSKTDQVENSNSTNVKGFAAYPPEVHIPDSVCNYKKFQKCYTFLESKFSKPSIRYETREIPGNFLITKVYMDTTLMYFTFVNGDEKIILGRSFHFQSYLGEENLYYEQAWIEIK